MGFFDFVPDDPNWYTQSGQALRDHVAGFGAVASPSVGSVRRYTPLARGFTKTDDYSGLKAALDAARGNFDNYAAGVTLPSTLVSGVAGHYIDNFGNRVNTVRNLFIPNSERDRNQATYDAAIADVNSIRDVQAQSDAAAEASDKGALFGAHSLRQEQQKSQTAPLLQKLLQSRLAERKAQNKQRDAEKGLAVDSSAISLSGLLDQLNIRGA